MGIIEKTTDTRPAILVIGTPQSGVPGFAKLLDDLQPRHSGETANRRRRRKGFWDAARTNALHLKISKSVGTTADDWQPIDPAWFTDAAAQTLHTKAAALINRNFNTHGTLPVDDPRLARFLPFWMPAFHRAGVSVPAIHIHRHPSDTAQALLEQRGISTALGMLQWLSFTLETEAATRGVPRVFLDYDELNHDSGPCVEKINSTLALNLPKLSPPTETETNETAAPRQTGDLPEPVETARSILDRWCEQGEDVRDYPRLDQLRRLTYSLISDGDATEDAAPDILIQAMGPTGGGSRNSIANLKRMRKPELVSLARALTRANAALCVPAPSVTAAPLAPQDALARRDRELAKFALLLQKAEKLPVQLRADLTASRSENLALERKIATMTDKADRLARENRALHQSAAAQRKASESDQDVLSAEIVELRRLLAEVTRERDAIRISRAWRATAPLRKLASVLRVGRR